MKRAYSGAATGKGSAYSWEGNRDVGKGSIEITETSPPSRVQSKLDMLKPIEGHNIIAFSLEPNGDVTNVTWSMHGPSTYISKVMGVFINMDTMSARTLRPVLPT